MAPAAPSAQDCASLSAAVIRACAAFIRSGQALLPWSGTATMSSSLSLSPMAGSLPFINRVLQFGWPSWRAPWQAAQKLV
jgi:hypothetical protein